MTISFTIPLPSLAGLALVLGVILILFAVSPLTSVGLRFNTLCLALGLLLFAFLRFTNNNPAPQPGPVPPAPGPAPNPGPSPPTPDPLTPLGQAIANAFNGSAADAEMMYGLCDAFANLVESDGQSSSPKIINSNVFGKYWQEAKEHRAGGSNIPWSQQFAPLNKLLENTLIARGIISANSVVQINQDKRAAIVALYRELAQTFLTISRTRNEQFTFGRPVVGHRFLLLCGRDWFAPPPLPLWYLEQSDFDPLDPLFVPRILSPDDRSYHLAHHATGVFLG